ncbi:MAG: septum formation protein Maf [Bacteroidetes bacterium]|nr:septum formation protein Maf [Bacteroidota bacterium]MBS1973811.1 septum formation protein Maf [Bacteroidota bacterium]
MNKIILASQSPRRKQLLQWAEIPFDVVVKETDESYPENLGIEQVAKHIAGNKAAAVKQEISEDDIIIAADTIVVLDNEVIGKPKDAKDAVSILTRLSGNKHLVVTGVVITQGKKEISFADTTEVWFHDLTRGQIEFYVRKYKPYDKAGAYAIQEWIGVVGIKKISGDFYNVMGLPVSRVVKELSNFRV